MASPSARLRPLKSSGQVILDFTWKLSSNSGRVLSLICRPFRALASMTVDEKIRIGMVALTGASLVFASLGFHAGPLEIIGGNAVG